MQQVTQTSRRYIVEAPAGDIHRPDGTIEHLVAPAVWTLAHRGFSGGGRLDVWAYPSEHAALQAGAQLALECGIADSAPDAQVLFDRGQYAAVMVLYEENSPIDHVLRVQAAWLCDEEDNEA